MYISPIYALGLHLPRASFWHLSNFLICSSLRTPFGFFRGLLANRGLVGAGRLLRGLALFLHDDLNLGLLIFI